MYIRLIFPLHTCTVYVYKTAGNFRHVDSIEPAFPDTSSRIEKCNGVVCGVPRHYCSMSCTTSSSFATRPFALIDLTGSCSTVVTNRLSLPRSRGQLRIALHAVMGMEIFVPMPLCPHRMTLMNNNDETCKKREARIKPSV